MVGKYVRAEECPRRSGRTSAQAWKMRLAIAEHAIGNEEDAIGDSGKSDWQPWKSSPSGPRKKAGMTGLSRLQKNSKGYAQPWKSGALAPRKRRGMTVGFSPGASALAKQ